MIMTGQIKLFSLNIAKLFVVLLFALTLFSCDQSEEPVPVIKKVQEKPVPLLEKIKKRGKLIVLTANLQTTYYYDRDNNLSGPEYDMTQSFAKSLKVDVEYKVYDSTKAILEALRNKEGDLAAAGLTVTNIRKKEFDFGPVYQKVNEYVVCRRDKKRIKKSKN